MGAGCCGLWEVSVGPTALQGLGRGSRLGVACTPKAGGSLHPKAGGSLHALLPSPCRPTTLSFPPCTSHHHAGAAAAAAPHALARRHRAARWHGCHSRAACHACAHGGPHEQGGSRPPHVSGRASCIRLCAQQLLPWPATAPLLHGVRTLNSTVMLQLPAHWGGPCAAHGPRQVDPPSRRPRRTPSCPRT